VNPYNESDLINFLSRAFKVEHIIEPNQEINKLERDHTEPNENVDEDQPIPQINEDNRIAPGHEYYEMLNSENVLLINLIIPHLLLIMNP
jgi:hypothetical protein